MAFLGGGEGKIEQDPFPALCRQRVPAGMEEGLEPQRQDGRVGGLPSPRQDFREAVSIQIGDHGVDHAHLFGTGPLEQGGTVESRVDQKAVVIGPRPVRRGETKSRDQVGDPVSIQIGRGGQDRAHAEDFRGRIEPADQAAGGAGKKEEGSAPGLFGGSVRGSGNHVGNPVAIEVHPAGEGPSQGVLFLEAVEFPDQGPGDAGNRPHGADTVQAGAARTGNPDQEVRVSVSVQVARRRQTGAVPFQRPESVPPLEQAARCPGVEEGRAHPDAGSHRGLWGADGDVRDTVAVGISDARQRSPETRVGFGSIEAPQQGPVPARDEVDRSEGTNGTDIGPGSGSQDIRDAVAVHIAGSRQVPAHAVFETPAQEPPEDVAIRPGNRKDGPGTFGKDRRRELGGPHQKVAVAVPVPVPPERQGVPEALEVPGTFQAQKAASRGTGKKGHLPRLEEIEGAEPRRANRKVPLAVPIEITHALQGEAELGEGTGNVLGIEDFHQADAGPAREDDDLAEPLPPRRGNEIGDPRKVFRNPVSIEVGQGLQGNAECFLKRDPLLFPEEALVGAGIGAEGTRIRGFPENEVSDAVAVEIPGSANQRSSV